MTGRILIDIDGMKMSKPGFNVQTTTKQNLIFNSDLRMFKVVQSGAVAVAAQSTANFNVPIAFDYSLPLISCLVKIGAVVDYHLPVYSTAVAYLQGTKTNYQVEATFFLLYPAGNTYSVTNRHSVSVVFYYKLIGSY